MSSGLNVMSVPESVWVFTSLCFLACFGPQVGLVFCMLEGQHQSVEAVYNRKLFFPQLAPTTPPGPGPSNAYVQATLCVGSVNFYTVDFGGAFFNSFYCVPCLLPDTLVLRCMLFIFCVKAALLVKRAAAFDKVEISGNFDRWMSQQYCEWINDKVDERKPSHKSPILCADHEEFAKHGGCSLCPTFFPKPAPKPAPKPPAKSNAQGKKKKHVQQFMMRCSLRTKKGFISEPVDP